MVGLFLPSIDDITCDCGTMGEGSRGSWDTPKNGKWLVFFKYSGEEHLYQHKKKNVFSYNTLSVIGMVNNMHSVNFITFNTIRML